MKYKKIILVIVLSLGFILTNIVMAAEDSTAAAEETQKNQLKFIPAISIPGFYAAESTVDIDGSSLAKYIKALYRYGGMFAGIVAMFMLVYAGWEWLLAGGNSSKISSARDKINSTLIGLTVLFGGYLLLSLISQRLISFEPIRTELADIPCPLFKTEESCPAPSCVWVDSTPEEIAIDASLRGKCVDTETAIGDETPNENTCSDLTSNESCTANTLCQWDVATSKCNAIPTMCGLNAAQVAANPPGLNCCAKMLNSEPSSPVAEYSYAIYSLGQYCSDVCSGGVWQGRDIDICQVNLGF